MSRVSRGASGQGSSRMRLFDIGSRDGHFGVRLRCRVNDKEEHVGRAAQNLASKNAVDHLRSLVVLLTNRDALVTDP